MPIAMYFPSHRLDSERVRAGRIRFLSSGSTKTRLPSHKHDRGSFRSISLSNQRFREMQAIAAAPTVLPLRACQFVGAY